jgi:ketosteroid isomerase-like protein
VLALGGAPAAPHDHALEREHDHPHHEAHDQAIDRARDAAESWTHGRQARRRSYPSVMDELADRVALGELVAAYAHHVDRLDPDAIAELFCVDGVLAIYDGDPSRVEPDRVRTGRQEIAEAMRNLSRYDVTTHFLGQQSLQLDGDTATGETYCIAHHILSGGGERRARVLSMRYLDRFERNGERWLIAERRLVIDWSDERVLPPS